MSQYFQSASILSLKSFTTVDLFQDLFSRGSPEEGFGILVVFVEVLLDGLDEVVNAVESSSEWPLEAWFAASRQRSFPIVKIFLRHYTGTGTI